jgi:multidrug efflux system membrane fusion protein
VRPGTETRSVLPRVEATISEARPRRSDLVLRGQTQALRKVVVRAETEGVVAATPVEKGTLVETGTVICELDPAAREAQLMEASAVLEQRRLEFVAARKLAEKGHRSETQVAGARAAYDAARAAKRAMEVEIARTKIRAPFDGVFDARQVEIGDFMTKGQACGTVMDQDPFLVVASVSERDVGKIAQGAEGTARLVTGETVDGRIRFISQEADPATRTFRVELEVPNDEMRLRDGVTAELILPVDTVPAHLISPAILGLDDAGRLGVRTLEDGDTVRFRTVEILADTVEGVWVTGLPERATLVTVGQEFVTSGQKVDAVIDGREPRS